MKVKNNKLAEQINELKGFLLSHCYTPKTVHYYQHCWNRLMVYAEEKDVECYSKQLGIDFLRDAYVVKDIQHPNDRGQRKSLRAIRLLESFLETGSIAPNAERSSAVPEPFRDIYERYIGFIKSLGQRPSSIKAKKSRVRVLLLYLQNVSLCDISKLSKSILIEFMAYLKNKYTSVARGNILYTIKDFLMFCTSEDIIHEDVAKLIKCIYTNPNGVLPSVYSRDEVRRILEAVDRETPDGKKDYAMLSLAAILGMRAYDIITLNMEDIKWEKGNIEFFQQKTGIFIQLPMPKQIQYTLADYLSNSRPNTTEYHNLFLRVRAPLIPYSESAIMSYIVSKYIQLAGIATDGRSHGPHSLRHSLASTMLSEGQSLPVIASALGHSNTKNTSHYIRIDIEKLRSVGLEVPV